MDGVRPDAHSLRHRRADRLCEERTRALRDGFVAVSSDGPPMLLDCSQQPTFVDPQAAVCWSANLQPQVKSTFKMGSLIGRGSGESFQLGFHGPGFVVVQPSEGQPVVAAS